MIDTCLAVLLAANLWEDPVDRRDPHAELLAAAARHLPSGADVLDAGCGLGLLLEHLPDLASYVGIDVSEALIGACRRRHRGRREASFLRADLARAGLGVARFDAIAFLHTLGAPGLDPSGLLRRARAALRNGGRLLVAGASAPARFARIRERALARERLPAAARAALRSPGQGWSLEGMLALLSHVGYGRVRGVRQDLYEGAAYLVAVER